MAMSMVGCQQGKTATEPSETDSVSEPTVQTEQGESVSPEPSETTPPKTEPTEDLTKDISYYPYPLLDMTVEQIEDKYGEILVQGTSFDQISCTVKGYDGFELL